MGWDIVLILCGLLCGFFLSGDDSSSVIAEVLLASGLIPVLLALPIIFADWTLSVTDKKLGMESMRCFFLRDWRSTVAYSVYFMLFIGGFFWLYKKDRENLTGACAEVFMEVGIMYFVGTFLGIAPVDADDTRAFLSKDQAKQVERSQTLHAPYALATDYALCLQEDEDDAETIHKQMAWHFPFSLPSSSEDVEDEIVQLHEDHAELREDQPTAFISHILLDSPPGWHDPWYIAALGRCDYLAIPDLIPGLLTFLSGAAFPRDRFVVQSAVTSLGNLYFGTGNRKITTRILYMWMTHEISNVRDTCLVALRAINHKETVVFLDELEDVRIIQSVSNANKFFKDQCMNTDPLHCKSIGEVTSALRTPSASGEMTMMYLISACVLLDSGGAADEQVQALVHEICVRILSSGHQRHIVHGLGLEAIRRASLQFTKNGTWNAKTKAQIHSMATWACRTSVFKSVRTNAQRVLQETDHPHMSVYSCFSTDGATNYFKENSYASDDIRSVLEDSLGTALYEDLVHTLDTMATPSEEIDAMFVQFDESREQRFQLAALSDPTKDPTLLLYAHLSRDESHGQGRIPNSDIQSRLNSVDRLERYVGLLCIAHYGRKAAKIRERVLPAFAGGELISDVRDLAVAIMEVKTADICNLGDCCENPDGIHSDQRDSFVTKELERLKSRTALSASDGANGYYGDSTPLWPLPEQAPTPPSSKYAFQNTAPTASLLKENSGRSVWPLDSTTAFNPAAAPYQISPA